MKRIKEQIAVYGAENTIDENLLSIILGSKKAARELLEKFDTFRKLSLASDNELNLSEGMLVKLKACLEIARRFQAVNIRPGVAFQGSQQVFYHYHEKLRDQKREKFFSILLDTKHRVIKEELVSIGSLNLSIVHPREVFSSAIKEAAQSILFVHNHPSGEVIPSQEDIALTKRLVEVGKIIGIEVLDHIIIGNGRYMSFTEEKLI